MDRTSQPPAPEPAQGLAQELAKDLARELGPQVQRNCHLANAQGAGHFSLCGLLLRLRHLYKWEHCLAPWQEQESGPVLEWVQQQEDLWLELEQQQFRPLQLAGRQYDPFDLEGINQVLEPAGLLYGAGRAGGLLPIFFLGRLLGRQQLGGLEVYSLGRELCQDIYLLPGLRQHDRVFLRRDPMPYLLWDHLADPRPSQVRFTTFALAEYGLGRAELLANPSWEAMEPVLQAEMQGVLWHELGEAASGEMAGDLLEQAISQHHGTELEHFVRGVKDLLADTGPQGRLARIASEGRAGVLGLYPVWLAGFPRMLFPEIDQAVRRFMAQRDWSLIDQAREQGWQRARTAVERLGPLLGQGPPQQVLQEARRQVIEPLTGGHAGPEALEDSGL